MSCPHEALCIYEARPIMLAFCYCSIGELKEKPKKRLKRVLSNYLLTKYYCVSATFSGSYPLNLELSGFLRNFLEGHDFTV